MPRSGIELTTSRLHSFIMGCPTTYLLDIMLTDIAQNYTLLSRSRLTSQRPVFDTSGATRRLTRYQLLKVAQGGDTCHTHVPHWLCRHITSAVLRLECSLDCISGSVGHQQNIFRSFSHCQRFFYRRTKFKTKKINLFNWVSGSPPMLYKLVLSPVPIVHTNFQENPLTTLGISRHF